MVRFSAETTNLSLHWGASTHPAFYSVDAGGSFPEGKAAGAWKGPFTSIYCRM